MIFLFRNGRCAMLLVVVAALVQPALCQTSPPRVLYSDLESGPNSGGENNGGVYVTVYGRNFGAAGGTSAVTIGGGQAAAYAIWSDTKITFQLGPAATTGNIVVKTAAGTSNGIPFTVRAGRILFVATNGGDSKNGSFGAPWRTLPHAVQTAAAGDTIYAMDGVSQTTDDGQGWDAALVLRAEWCSVSGYPRALLAYPGATVMIGNPSGNSPASGLRTTDFSAGGGACAGNWVFGGLLFRGAGPVGVNGPSSGWRFVGNDISCPTSTGDGGGGACFETTLASNVKFLGNNVHDAGAANASALFQGVYFSTDSNHIEMGWNTVANVRGCRGVQIHSSPLGSGYPNSGYNQYDISIHDNLIHDTQCDAIIVDTIDPSKGPVSIYNNVIYNGGKGPNNPEQSGGWSCINVPANSENGPAGSGTIDIYNNTLYACGTFTSPPYSSENSAIAYNGGNRNVNLRIRNNIIHQVKTSLYPAGVPYLVIWNPGASNGNAVCADRDNCAWIQGSNNLFFGSGPAPANTNITASVNADPLFVNLSQYDFHLQAGSPARGKGVNTGILTDKDGNPRGGGLGYDIGAFQSLGLTISSVACAPAQIITPATTVCTVSLSGSAPAGGMQVRLASDNTSVSLPDSVTVPAGSSTVVSSAQVTSVTAPVNATITATAGNSQQTLVLKLLPPDDLIPVVLSAVNAASYLAGPVCPGEVVALFGRNLGPDVPAGALPGPQGSPTELVGTKAVFDGAAGGLLYVQSHQVNVIVPRDIAGRTAVSLVVEASGRASAPLTLAVQPTAPGVFTVGASGGGAAVILNADGGLNSPLSPAAKGSVIRLFATGLGETSAEVQANGSDLGGTPLVPVSVNIGGVGADVLQAAGLAGIYYIDTRVPEAAPPGATVPLTLMAGNAASQGGVTLAVR